MAAPDVAAAFKQAMRGMASTVTVVTAHDGARHHGMTATAVSSLSMDPPALVVCINRTTLLHDIMYSARCFCVSVLDEAQDQVSAAFGGTAGAAERFAVGNWRYRDDGLGFLADAQANIFCDKAAAMPFGTHTIIVGTVSDVRIGDRQQPLIYKDASYCTSQPRGQFG